MASKLQDHPSWVMLEKKKNTLKKHIEEMDADYHMPKWHPIYQEVVLAHNMLVKLQYKVEDKLMLTGEYEK